jgi:opacity protein-like surface antigen
MLKRKIIFSVVISLFLTNLVVKPVMAEENVPESEEVASDKPAVQNAKNETARANAAAASGDVVPDNGNPPPHHHHKEAAQTTQATAKPLAVNPAFQIPPLQTILSFAVGPSLVKSGNAQTLNLPDSSISYFHPRHPVQVQTLYNAFLGVVYQFLPKWALQAGISYTQPSTFTIEGIEAQNTSSRNYDFNYNVAARQLLVEGHIVYDYGILHPYFSFGMGPSFNSAYLYQSFPPPGTSNSPTFMNDNNMAFSFALGFGVDVDVMKSVRLGLGYKFSDFGRADLGQGTQFTGTINQAYLSRTIEQNNLYSNALLAQITIVPF